MSTLVIERADLMKRVINLEVEGKNSHSEVETMKKVVGASKEIKVDNQSGQVKVKMGANVYGVTYKEFSEAVKECKRVEIEDNKDIDNERYIQEMVR